MKHALTFLSVLALTFCVSLTVTALVEDPCKVESLTGGMDPELTSYGLFTEFAGSGPQNCCDRITFNFVYHSTGIGWLTWQSRCDTDDDGDFSDETWTNLGTGIGDAPGGIGVQGVGTAQACSSCCQYRFEYDPGFGPLEYSNVVTLCCNEDACSI